MGSWTAMTDLSTGDLVTETHMDNIRTNLEYVLDPNWDEGSDSSANTTTSTSFVDIDAVNLSISVTTYGGPLIIIFTGEVGDWSPSYSTTAIDFVVDGTSVSGGTGVLVRDNAVNAVQRMVGALVHIEAVDAGAHTIKVQWKTSTGTLTLRNYGRLIALEI